MAKTEHSLENLTVAKIVSTPTLTSWSQAYNAGGFFALLSLSKKEEENEEEDKLSHLGKSFLNNLEAEYFSLEAKNLNSIKQAVLSSIETLEAGHLLSLVVASVVDNILYSFSINGGKVFIKRGDETGSVLLGESEEVVSSSGFLKNLDTIILETKQFNDIISKESLKDSLDHFSPQDIAENLSPKIHETNEGGAAAIFISYQEKQIEEKEEETIGDFEQEVKKNKLEVRNFKIKNYLKNFKFQFPALTFSKKIFMAIGVLLVFILIFGITFTLNRQKSEQSKLLFEEIYSPALKKYDEGEALISLNKNLARDDLSQAKKILEEGNGKFEKDSNEAKQIEELLAKIEASLTLASDINNADTKEVNQNDSPLLSWFIKKSASYAVLEGSNIYFLNNDGIYRVAKESDSPKLVIKKSWEDAGGLGLFTGNVYVLDKKAGQIYKFVSPNFGKTNYLSQTSDLSKAVSVAIDSSIWILQKDGQILKFLRGKAESFTLNGLDKPLSNPSRIYTNREINNLYILDSGNQRIVVLNKEGAYQSQYQAAVIKGSTDFEVLEKDKKIFILSSGKIYQIDLK